MRPVRFGEDGPVDRVVRIGKYLARRALGAGSFATVWLADDEVLDAPVAIKVLADNWARHPDVRRRFIDEAKLLRRIDHERIVRVHEVDELPDGRPYFVMTWADRGTLQERLVQSPDGRLDIDRAVDLAVEVCECLAIVHDFGAVHRDVKPSNVLFRSVRSHERAAASRRGIELGDEQVVLGDFGLAKDLAAASGFTQAAGTPAYMAPEQALPTAIIDRRVDVYGATAVLYEMLTGRPALAASTLSDVRRGPDGGGGVAPVRSLRPEVPPSIAAVIGRGLAFDPDQRYASALDLAAALRAAQIDVAPRPVGRVSLGPAPSGAAGRVQDLVARARRNGLVTDDALDEVEAMLARPVRVVVAPAYDGHPWAGMIDEPDGATLERTGDVTRLADADVAVLVLERPDDDAVAAFQAELRARATGPVAVVVAAADLEAATASRAVRALTTDVTGFDAEGAALVIEVTQTLVDRHPLLRAATALAALAGVAPPPGPDQRAAAQDLADAVDGLRLELPAMAEIDALRLDLAGRWALAASLRREMRRILLWTSPGQRLDRVDATSDELRTATQHALERWRTLRNTDRLPFAARNVGELVERSLERLWMELEP